MAIQIQTQVSITYKSGANITEWFDVFNAHTDEEGRIVGVEFRQCEPERQIMNIGVTNIESVQQVAFREVEVADEPQGDSTANAVDANGEPL